MSRIGTITLVAIFGTVFVLLFPAVYGPFTATNGPTTAFRAAAAIQKLLILLSQSLIVALLRPTALSMTLAPVFASCAGQGSPPVSLRC
jgi:hypothetical protein